MLFSSIIFLCAFLPLTFLLHLIMPGTKSKNAVLVLASLIFYGFGEPVYVFLLLLSTLIHHLVGRYLSKPNCRSKPAVAFIVVMNLALLGVFKYSAFFVTTINSALSLAIPVPAITLPIGISFFTFQLMSYVFDVRRDPSLVSKNFADTVLYISFFPQLIAGPIVKYSDIALQIKNRRMSSEKIAEGILRFICGLAKKLLLSGAVGEVADAIFTADAKINLPLAWLAALTYALQIYYDFSGYSDMALGLAKMFGFELLENFNYPYSAQSMTDFWRRWHISLSTWFKEYLYIPLGGNRKGRKRTVINKIIVFFLTGLWHGANFTFIIWGLYHGLLLLLEEYKIIPVEKIKFRPVKTLYAFTAALLGFVVFRAESVSQAWIFIKAAFTGYDFNPQSMNLFTSNFSPHFVFILIISVVFVFPVKEALQKALSSLPTLKNALTYSGAALLLLACLMSLASGSFNPFIYFQF